MIPASMENTSSDLMGKDIFLTLPLIAIKNQQASVSGGKDKSITLMTKHLGKQSVPTGASLLGPKRRIREASLAAGMIAIQQALLGKIGTLIPVKHMKSHWLVTLNKKGQKAYAGVSAQHSRTS